MANTRGTTAFARLAALAVSSKKAEDESDEDKAKKNKAADDQDEDKAQDETDETKGAKDNNEKDDDDSDCDKAAADDEDEKASDGDDDEDDKKGRKAARAAERARIAAILTSEHAARSQAHYASAAYLALETDMSAKSAIGVLMCMPVPEKSESGNSRKEAARARLDSTPNPKVSSDATTSGGPSLADQIVAAGKKRRGEA